MNAKLRDVVDFSGRITAELEYMQQCMNDSERSPEMIGCAVAELRRSIQVRNFEDSLTLVGCNLVANWCVTAMPDDTPNKLVVSSIIVLRLAKYQQAALKNVSGAEQAVARIATHWRRCDQLPKAGDSLRSTVTAAGYMQWFLWLSDFAAERVK